MAVETSIKRGTSEFCEIVREKKIENLPEQRVTREEAYKSLRHEGREKIQTHTATATTRRRQENK